MFARLTFVALLALTPLPAAAQTAPQTAATAEQIAAASAHADRLIAAAGAQDLFVNKTDSEVPTVRHVRSGLTCEFTGHDARDVIRLYPQQPGGPPRGDDVGCGTWIGRTYVSLFATRYPTPESEQALMQSAVFALQQSWPHARPYEGPLEFFLLDGQTEPLIAAFDVELEGRASRSIILLQKLDEWAFKARATGPASDNSVNELSGMAFSLALPGAHDAAAAALRARD